MGFFGKLKFWKKKEDLSDLGMGKEELGFPGGSAAPGTELGMPQETGLPTEGQTTESIPSQPSEPAYPDLSKPYTTTPVQEAAQQPAEGVTDIYKVSKEIEVISSKLDALRASLDSINQRLANLERIAEGDKKRGW